MSANDMQIGGDHYKSDYQHWDWVTDIDLPYLLACATKYVSRWEKKNGIEDLKKAVHYLHKAVERGVRIRDPRGVPHTVACIIRYTKQLPVFEVDVLQDILHSYFNRAIINIESKIDELEGKPVASSVH